MAKRRGESPFQIGFILLLIVVLPIFLFREYRIISSKKNIPIAEDDHFYADEPAQLEERTFVCIIPVENCAVFLDRNIQSILQQEYSHYRIVYIDIGSEDGSFEELQKYASDTVTVVRAESKHEFFAAYCNAVEQCQDNDIILHLLGADWLAHPHVFSTLNQIYQKQDVWLAYPQYLEYPSYHKGIYRPLPKKNLYKKRVHRAPWVMSHCKIFYAGLFKQIGVTIQEKETYFFTFENMEEQMIPLAEVGKAHVRFIPEVLYVHNEIPNYFGGDRFRLGTFGENFARFLGVTSENDEVRKESDVLILSENSPERLEKCLPSLLAHLHGVKGLFVLYNGPVEGYNSLIRKYPSVIFIHEENGAELEDLLLLTERGAEYVFLCRDTIVVEEVVELIQCAELLERARGYGFYFHAGNRGNGSVFEGDLAFSGTRCLGEGVYSWHIAKGHGIFEQPDTLGGALYRKKDVYSRLRKLEKKDMSSFIRAWPEQSHRKEVGLFFATPPVLAE